MDVLNCFPAYLAHIKADYPTPKTCPEAYYETTVTEGPTYFKVISNAWGSKSVHSFVVKQDGPKFKAGDILKAASFKAPALNFARGNVLTGDFSRIRWTGAG